MAKNGKTCGNVGRVAGLEGAAGEPEGERAERLGLLPAGGSLAVEVFPLATAAEERHPRVAD